MRTIHRKRPSCSYPLTGAACVTRVYSAHALLLTGPHGVNALGTYGIGAVELGERLGLSLRRA
ncbi:hypothetical protein [Streptomyces sp. NPDC057107]|uniref:hypothetical protein n=1 Tax=unclassified Streptomyces TaxID=2593676 RepID=UPI00124A90BA